ncbi:tetratricopeptide repeat protein [Methylobacterium fujisawaense]|uniref:tetratricopeptide repeat protein n=1 Tax=Methylobacterium fujisawaense TaxID=107400 RepID=UPI002F35639D
MAEGRALYAAGNYAGAIVAFTDAIRATPDDPKAYEARAAAYLRANDAVHAIQDLDEAIRRDPVNVAAYTNRSVADLALGQSEAAIRDASEAIRLRPDGAATAYSNRANGLSRLGGRDGEAAADYDRAIAIDPRLANAYVGRGNLFAKAGDNPRAIEAYTTALFYAPRDPRALNGRGITLIRLRDYAKARLDFSDAIASDPSNAQYYYNRSLTYAASERQRALEDVEQAILLEPRYDRALRSRGRLLLSYGKYVEAAQTFSAALSVNPSDALAAIGRGEAYYRQHKCNLAMVDFDEGLTHDPNNVRGHLGRSACLLDLNHDLAGARAAADTAIRQKNTDPGAFNLRGVIRERQGDLAGAKEDLDEAIRLSAAFAAAFGNRSRVNRSLGNAAEGDADQARAQQLGAGTTMSPQREQLLDETRTPNE